MAKKDGLIKRWFGARRRSATPTGTLGTHGLGIFGGYLQTIEKDPRLASAENRYRLYSDILTNTPIVSAGVRYFLNLLGHATWNFNPSDPESNEAMDYAERAERVLTEDPETTWARIVRRAAMYRYYGFSVQEWTAMRREDGVITLKDVAPRAQRTIRRWDVEDSGQVLGMTQLSPQTGVEIYLPRSKVMYLVDDSLHDSPEGLGIFRNLVEPAMRLRRYQQLEGFGFETDLRGIPVGHAPFAALDEMQTDGRITAEQRDAIEKPLRQFITQHIRSPEKGPMGLLLDSTPWQSEDDAMRPSSLRQWDVRLLSGDSSSFQENAEAIKRLVRDLAVILGVDQLLLGTDRVGSFALSRDKTNTFFLQVDSALSEIKAAVVRDLLIPIWDLNGWDREFLPAITIDPVRFTDVQAIASTLRDLATAGAVILPDDPAVGDVRDIMGVSRTTEFPDPMEPDPGMNFGEDEE